MNVPILDLKPAYEELRGELDAAYHRVMESGWLLLGRELEAFEHEYAQQWGDNWLAPASTRSNAVLIRCIQRGADREAASTGSRGVKLSIPARKIPKSANGSNRKGISFRETLFRLPRKSSPQPTPPQSPTLIQSWSIRGGTCMVYQLLASHLA